MGLVVVQKRQNNPIPTYSVCVSLHIELFAYFSKAFDHLRKELHALTRDGDLHGRRTPQGMIFLSPRFKRAPPFPGNQRVSTNGRNLEFYYHSTLATLLNKTYQSMLLKDFQYISKIQDHPKEGAEKEATSNKKVHFLFCMPCDKFKFAETS